MKNTNAMSGGGSLKDGQSRDMDDRFRLSSSTSYTPNRLKKERQPAQSTGQSLGGLSHPRGQPKMENVMSDAPSRDEITARIEAAEARTDTKIVRIEGKLDLVISKIDDVRNDYRSIRGNIWIVFFGLAGLIVAIAIGIPSIYDFGTKIRDLVHSEVQSTTHSAH
jgi:hypothetical protein